MTRSINNAYWISVGIQREREATIELIKKLQKIQHSDFISGDAMTFIIENEEHLKKEEKDHPFIYEGWD